MEEDVSELGEGIAIKKLVEVRRAEREVSTAAVETSNHQGGRPGETAEIARELNIPEQTARDRIKLADDLEGHPDLAARVDAKKPGWEDDLAGLSERSPLWKAHPDDTPRSAHSPRRIFIHHHNI